MGADPRSVQAFGPKNAERATEVWLTHEPLHGSMTYQFTPDEARQLVAALEGCFAQIDAAAG
jgi:hypothetical protein